MPMSTLLESKYPKTPVEDKSVPNNNIGESVNSSFNLGEGGLKNDPHVIWGGN